MALLLTVLRPVNRGDRYLINRLSAIKKEIKYPREDAVELANKIKKLETSVEKIEANLDLENSSSLIGKQQQLSPENRISASASECIIRKLPG